MLSNKLLGHWQNNKDKNKPAKIKKKHRFKRGHRHGLPYLIQLVQSNGALNLLECLKGTHRKTSLHLGSYDSNIH